MLSELGNLSILISIIISIFLIFFSLKEIKDNKSNISIKIKNFSTLQLIFANLSFFLGGTQIPGNGKQILDF